MKASDFGPEFLWGVAVAAAQIEGAAFDGGKGPSIWDTFAARSGKTRKGAVPTVACDFYHRYKEDIAAVKMLGFGVFRFSISWPRIFPDGRGPANQEGLLFYHRVIDECLEQGLTPLVTLYHWDLPDALEREGGWTAYGINEAFNAFVQRCAVEYGYKVKYWIVLNEPFGYTSLGYMLGMHAPGKTGLGNFFAAVHHTALAQADGARLLRTEVSQACIGTTFSCSKILPYTSSANDEMAARRIDCLMNRLFVEPVLGMGYPTADWELLERFSIRFATWRLTERLRFDFDFIGLQNYFPLTVRYNPLVPVIQAWEVKARSRKRPHTAMGWEVNGNQFAAIIRQFAAYPNIPPIMITENGAAYADKLVNGKIHDAERIAFFKEYLQALLALKQEGLPITGYLVWTLMDNFEWAEGYQARFGLLYTDFKTGDRHMKDSAHWWKGFLKS
ncbi:beta-glucosidase [Pedobacter yulinensis]|uniref:Beta-glucosidase n=1 Tax=Pedobacter yulinensis TaxID=2126353 RepID=A0A2T3HGQ2_9SPHI|nr:GH1 family beta-glucosidase [Pedobacter yulinensis]PST81624.1 beta-glucosidase [Pedobacter yulinensis]